MTRRRRKAAGPSAVAAPREAPIVWPDHPLAASGGEILAARILPLMGHNARDFARAAAVCRGWRAASQAATAALSVYREKALQLPAPDCPIDIEKVVRLAWSPCGKFLAATVGDPPRLFIWRSATGALVNEFDLATPATAVPHNILEHRGCISVAFSRDSTHVLTHFHMSKHFAVWSVPDGQLLAVNRGDPGNGLASCADIGVPGSASDGLVGLGGFGAIDLFDVSPPPEGRGPSRPRLRGHVDLAPGGDDACAASFAISPNGSKFASAHDGVVHVYDVASLTRLAAYTSPSDHAMAAWAPDGRHVLVSWGKSACLWDFSRPEAPSVVTADVGPCARLHSWSPSGASYFAFHTLEGPSHIGRTPYALDERRAVDGSLVRTITLKPVKGYPYVRMSPDARALALYPSPDVTGAFPFSAVVDGPARIVVFG